MKNNVKNYLSLSALVAASALMVSCDDDTILNSATGTEIGDGIFNASKPVAPVPLAIFPLTSLKLSFNTAGGDCLGAAFDPGDELEIDFDSTTAVTGTQISGNSVADLGSDNIVIFGPVTQQGFVEGIVADPSASSWTISRIFSNSADNSGNLILSNLVLTPLAADQRSVTGSFTATAPVGIAFNQDTRNVVFNNQGLALNIVLPSGDNATVSSLTIYEDFGTELVEVQSLDGSLTFEDRLGSSNYGVSAVISNQGVTCTINFAYSKQAVEAIALGADPGGLLDGNDTDPEAAAIVATLDLNNSLDVSPLAPSNEIPVNAAGLYLNAGSTAGGVTGSYRHDFDSSTGTIESLINSAGF